MKKLLLLLIAPMVLQAQNFWTEVAPFGGDPLNYYPRQISIVNEDVVWAWGTGAVANSDYCSLTLDEGLTWNSVQINLPPATQISSLHATSATTAYISTFANEPTGVTGVWKTTNSGTTWTQIGSADFPALMFTNFVHFFSANNGLVVSDPDSNGFQIYRTNNAGANWTQVPAANIPAPLPYEYGYTSVLRTKNNGIWFGTNKGRIFYSYDAGATWTVYQSPVSDFGNANISGSYDFRSAYEGVLVTNDFHFYRTFDGGVSWNQEFPTTAYRNFETVFVPNTNNTYFSIGQDSELTTRGSSYSTDGGLNWIDLNDVDADPVLPYSVKFASGTVGFCIGTYESDPLTLRFFRLTDPMNRLLKNTAFNQTQFTLSPNPVQDFAKISASNPMTRVTVTDLTGKTVLTQTVNATETALDLSGLQTGIYVAKISAENGFGQSIKIIKQ